LTATINGCDVEKDEYLRSAKLPVDGLGVSDQGVTWQGLPFDQASTAIRTRVSVAIGAALAPRLRIALVRNGNDLDGHSLALLAESAKAHGLQVWVERIAGGGDTPSTATVLIVDGSRA
jgi:hypothetical protein